MYFLGLLYMNQQVFTDNTYIYIYIYIYVCIHAHFIINYYNFACLLYILSSFIVMHYIFI